MTTDDMIECLQSITDIMGMDAWLYLSAGHYQFWIEVTEEQIPENSIDGLFLQAHGWSIEDGYWTFYV